MSPQSRAIWLLPRIPTDVKQLLTFLFKRESLTVSSVVMEWSEFCIVCSFIYSTSMHKIWKTFMQGLVLFWNIISKCVVVDKKLSAITGLTAAKDLQIRRSFCTLVLIFGMLHFDNPGDLQKKRISDKDIS